MIFIPIEANLPPPFLGQRFKQQQRVLSGSRLSLWLKILKILRSRKIKYLGDKKESTLSRTDFRILNNAKYGQNNEPNDLPEKQVARRRRRRLAHPGKPRACFWTLLAG